MEKQTKTLTDPMKKKEYNKKYYSKIREVIKASGLELKRGRPRKQVNIDEAPTIKKKRGRPPGSKNKNNKNKNNEELIIIDKKLEENISDNNINNS